MNPIAPQNSCRSAALFALSVLGCATAANAQVDNVDLAAQHFYRAHVLVSDGAVPADNVDAKLVNPWGLAFAPSSPVWVADNGTGVSTLYDGAGVPQALVVKIPPAKIGDGLGHPTGIVFNSTDDFKVSKNGTTAASVFLFASEDGSISGWAPTVDAQRAVRVVDRSAAGAVYKGLALGGDGAKHMLYATDFHNGHVDVFDDHYERINRAGAFQDNALPAHFAPFGIENVNGDIVVTYAKQDSARHDNLDGPGLGAVDVYDASGKLIRRFASGGKLNAPWGVALAPASFGQFGGALLVGNFGDGTINAFDHMTGNSLGTLRNSAGQPIRASGLWGIEFGNGVAGQPRNALFFAAGLNDEADGEYGVIRAVTKP
jgi:uncharacterized protein (TIGR03118 family)